MLNITTGKFHPFSSDFFSLPFHASLHVSRPLTEFWHTVSPQPHPHTSKLWEVEWQSLHPIQGPIWHGEFDHPCNPTIPSKIDFTFSKLLIRFFYDWLVLGGDWCSCAPVLRRQGFTLRLGHVVLILRVLAAHMVSYGGTDHLWGFFITNPPNISYRCCTSFLKTSRWQETGSVTVWTYTWPHFTFQPQSPPRNSGAMYLPSATPCHPGGACSHQMGSTNTLFRITVACAHIFACAYLCAQHGMCMRRFEFK